MGFNNSEKKEYMSYFDNETFTIHHHGNSVVNKFYQMHSEFMITYAFCSGTGSKDYINYVTLSERDQSYSQEAYDAHEDFFRNHPPHFHDYFELMVVLEGSITQKIEDREFRYDAGSCCLITRSLCHFETFNSTASVVFIGISLELIQSLFEEARRSTLPGEAVILSRHLYDFIARDIKSPGQKAYLDFTPAATRSDLHVMQFLTEHIMYALINPHFGSRHVALGLISTILSRLADPEYYNCKLTSLNQSSDFLIFSQIENILQENRGRISRAELSKQLNYSGDYINRIVNRYTGMCLSDYGMKFCLQEASIMLKTTDESISSIAQELGFTNRTFFYKMFQNQYGMTPREYRAAHR